MAAVLIPVVMLSLSISFGIFTLYSQYRFTADELSGVTTIEHLFSARDALQRLRGLSQIRPVENNAITVEERRSQARDEFFHQLDDAASPQSGAKFIPETELKQLKRRVWQLYNENTGDNSEFQKYSAAIDTLHAIVLRVADLSNLVLDPELDTYYMMEIAVKQIPELSEDIAVLRGIGSGILAGGTIVAEQLRQLRHKVIIADDKVKKFTRASAIVRHAATDTAQIFTANNVSLQQKWNAFKAVCKRVDNHCCNLNAETFFDSGTEVINTLRLIFSQTMHLLQHRLQQRKVNQSRLMLGSLLAALLAVYAIFYFSLSFYRQQQRSYRELERISITDALTGIPNRRYLDMVFDNELKRARRDGKGFTFGILDVDFFKQYNDTYGHQQGDDALCRVAEALAAALPRAGDYYFRYGGEEFCFIAAVPNEKTAAMIGERIRLRVEQLQIEHRKSSVSPHVTVSCGMIFVPEITTEDLDFMIKQADTMLYKAKSRGRNRCLTISTTGSGS